MTKKELDTEFFLLSDLMGSPLCICLHQGMLHLSKEHISLSDGRCNFCSCENFKLMTNTEYLALRETLND